MDSFKSQWQQAAAEHREQAYPGDLAAEVLAGRRSALRRYSPALVAAALAVACVMVFVDRGERGAASSSATATAQHEVVPAPGIDLPPVSGRMPSVKLPRVRAAQLPVRLNMPSMRPMSLRSPMTLKHDKENAS